MKTPRYLIWLAQEIEFPAEVVIPCTFYACVTDWLSVHGRGLDGRVAKTGPPSDGWRICLVAYVCAIQNVDTCMTALLPPPQGYVFTYVCLFVNRITRQLLITSVWNFMKYLDIIHRPIGYLSDLGPRWRWQGVKRSKSIPIKTVASESRDKNSNSLFNSKYSEHNST